jgi:hypothetical protein
MKALALMLYAMTNVRFGSIARLLNVRDAAALKWVRAEAAKLPKAEVRADPAAMRLEEMWYFLQIISLLIYFMAIWRRGDRCTMARGRWQQMKELIAHDTPETLLAASRRSRNVRTAHRLLAIRDMRVVT